MPAKEDIPAILPVIVSYPLEIPSIEAFSSQGLIIGSGRGIMQPGVLQGGGSNILIPNSSYPYCIMI